eukprot:1162014-Pelagomonas_calceolata.AAC.14
MGSAVMGGSSCGEDLLAFKFLGKNNKDCWHDSKICCLVALHFTLTLSTTWPKLNTKPSSSAHPLALTRLKSTKLLALPPLQLACARIGAVHSVVFAGFSADALCGRILDSRPRVVERRRTIEKWKNKGKSSLPTGRKEEESRVKEWQGKIIAAVGRKDKESKGMARKGHYCNRWQMVTMVMRMCISAAGGRWLQWL